MEIPIPETLPKPVIQVISTYIEGLYEVLRDNLYGIYMYGASVFPDTGPIQDIDLHVIVYQCLTLIEQTDLRTQYKDLDEEFPGLGNKLDAYVILLDDARRHSIPQHQVIPEIYDYSWALHCAHIRAGYYQTLWGSEPVDIFPNPTWEAVDAALTYELKYVLDHPQYPAYGILNLCRILYSYLEKNPVVSKQFSGHWGIDQYPQWASLIKAAIRFYWKENTPDDLKLMEVRLDRFYEFMASTISSAREKPIERHKP
jgi:hypothetical protein